MTNGDGSDEVDVNTTPKEAEALREENTIEEKVEAVVASQPDELSYSHKSCNGMTTPRDTEVPAPKTPAVPYGRPTLVPSHGDFPHPGSLLGPFFSLGRLGKGTFCSIHKCISLMPRGPRLVAAKVELTDYVNSGVLEGEAIMLQHLHAELPPRTVPEWVGYFKSDEASSIVMEYLPGNDMHHLREQRGTRRVSVKDAVYLTADVMLPLLRNMNDIGVVHRDVKPSNCVRYEGDKFCFVDFGLSKSIIVPAESPDADLQHPWKPQKMESEGKKPLYFRKERDKADFRGTSMYASLRVHQGRDYSRRDDVWSLLYVFCDLISGGLPWMSYAAARDRETCQKLKEQIHGLAGDGETDHTEQLLMGDDYHVSKYRRDMASKRGEREDKLPALAKPLEIAGDIEKVELLRTAFSLVADLSFTDEPDYAVVQECLHGFLEGPSKANDTVTSIEWGAMDPVSASVSKKKRKRIHAWKADVPAWGFESTTPRGMGDSLWEEAEAERADSPPKRLRGDAVDMARLPIEWQYRVAQVDYNTKNYSYVPGHIALEDWMLCSLPLLYGKWDAGAYEPGGHRTNSDTYRRDFYLKLVEKCLKCAARFGYFRNQSCYYEPGSSKIGDNGSQPVRKLRKVLTDMDTSTTQGGEMASVSRVVLGLYSARLAESKKMSAPPPVLTFGTGREI